jgi:hypothetical protein
VGFDPPDFRQRYDFRAPTIVVQTTKANTRGVKLREEMRCCFVFRYWNPPSLPVTRAVLRPAQMPTPTGDGYS